MVTRSRLALAIMLLASQAAALRAGKGFGFAYRYQFSRRGRGEALEVMLQAPEKVTVASTAYAKALRALEPDVTGFTVWRAGETLCRYMAETHAKLPYGPRVELGSGLGLCGIVIAMLDKDGAVGGKTSGGSRTAAVLCTDRSIALLEHVKENARLNHVEELVSTCRLEWGSECGVTELRERLCADQPSAARPALVIGSDICYSVEALPSLVATISMLDAQLNLLAIRPRFVDESDGSSEELVALKDLAAAAGYEVKEVLREEADASPGAKTSDASVVVVELRRS